MAYIAPFRALRYDQSRVKLNDTITQPYDKISAEMQEAYYQASPYNLVRIILGKKETTDRPGNDAYSRAAGAFSDWRRQGIFVQDRQPSIYLYVQRFTVPGIKTELERRGFIALGRIGCGDYEWVGKMGGEVVVLGDDLAVAVISDARNGRG